MSSPDINRLLRSVHEKGANLNTSEPSSKETLLADAKALVAALEDPHQVVLRILSSHVFAPPILTVNNV